MTANLLFIQSTARSGTTWMQSLLASNPGTMLFGELLSPSYFDWGYFTYLRNRVSQNPDLLLAKHDGQQQVAVEYVHRLSQMAPDKIALLDLKLEQLSETPGFAHAAYNSEASFIVLIRLNYLKQAISAVLMNVRMQSGDEAIHRDYVPPIMTIVVDVCDIIALMRKRKALTEIYFEMLKSYGRRYLKVTYEELTSSTGQRRLEEIQEFAGLDPVALTTTLAKQAPQPLSELVRNYDELVEAVRNSEFEHTLYMPG